jgi:hypothetical protein
MPDAQPQKRASLSKVVDAIKELQEQIRATPVTDAELPQQAWALDCCDELLAIARSKCQPSEGGKGSSHDLLPPPNK